MKFGLKQLETPNPSGIITRIVIIIGLFFFEQIGLSIIAFPTLDVFKIPVGSIWEYLILLVGSAVFIWAIYVAFIRMKATSPKDNWKLFEKPKLINILITLGGVVIMYVTAIIGGYLMQLVQAESANESGLDQMLQGMRPTTIVLYAFIMIGAPIFEELLFRGIFMNYFFVKPNQWLLNILFSALTFGMIHMVDQRGSVITFLATLTVYAGLGLGLAWVYKMTGKIQYPIAAHIIWNSMTVVATLLMTK